MTNANLEHEFEKRKPWVTKFVIDGIAYGGDFDAMHDNRLAQFFQSFPNVQAILELGSLEGGHTFALAKHPGVRRVVGIEGRQANVDRARFVQQLYEIENVEFVVANLERTDLASFGQFDAVFCVGLLYHLASPWRLVEQLPRVSNNLFIWTHYADKRMAKTTLHGLKGMMYQEHGLSDPLSGLSSQSFWPTFDSLMTMLKQYGFKTIHVIENNIAHPHGPCITLAAIA